MIKSVTITNYVGDQTKITLTEDQPEHGFLLTSVDGLGPAKANINLTELATIDGAFYNSAILDTRNLVLGITFTAAPTIEDTRQRTYKYFPIKKELEFIIETDNRILRTNGYVESNEPDIFSDQEGCSISIICPYPFFYSAENDGVNSVIFYGTQPMFEFVYWNEGHDPVTEFGSIQFKREETIFYEGESDVGVLITIHAVDEASGVVTIYNTGTREVMRIDTSKLASITGLSITGLSLGDDILISTIRGEKWISFVHQGISYNILNAITRDADWFTLTKGANTFAYTCTTGAENLYFTMQYPVIYEGA